jgi:hypothetical protein
MGPRILWTCKYKFTVTETVSMSYFNVDAIKRNAVSTWNENNSVESESDVESRDAIMIPTHDQCTVTFIVNLSLSTCNRKNRCKKKLKFSDS